MLQSLKQWLGRSPEPEFNRDPFGRGPQSASVQQPAVAVVEEVSPAIVLQREEIIDARTRIAGYRFGARLSDSSNQHSLRMTFEALKTGNVAAFAERRLALIPIKALNWFRFDYASLIGPHTAYLLDPPPQEAESVLQWREVIHSIRSTGARVALVDADIADDAKHIRECADILLIDYSAHSLSIFEQIMRQVRHDYPKLEIIVGGISSWPERRLCVERGATYCIGSFTTTDEVRQETKEIGQGRLLLIEMLNLLRQDADLEQITKVAKRDAGVALKIVAMANSPLQGLSKPVASIEQAVMILGREQLYRWLSVAMFRIDTDSPRDEVLLELAMARGHFMELVGRNHLDKRKCEELFLVGLLSLLDCMLGMPMAKLLERLHLSDEMRDVLLRSEGQLARYLMLAIAVEKGRAESISRLAAQLAISEKNISAASAEALAWIDNSMQSG